MYGEDDAFFKTDMYLQISTKFFSGYNLITESLFSMILLTKNTVEDDPLPKKENKFSHFCWYKDLIASVTFSEAIILLDFILSSFIK